MRADIKNLIVKEIKGLWGDDPIEGQPSTSVIKTNDLSYEGSIDFSNITQRNIDLEKAKKNYLQPGDLLIEKSGGTKDHSVGYVDYFDGDRDTYVCNNFILAIRPNPSVVIPKYLFYALKFLYENGAFSDCYNKTTGIQNLKCDFYLKKEINVPSFEEQANVVKILDCIVADIKKSKRQSALLDEIVKSRFSEMFESRFETQPLVKLSSIAVPLIGLTYHPENVSSTGTIVLRSGNIQNGELELKDDVVRVSGLKINDSKMIKNLDILMCARNGSARLVGKTCLIKDPKEQMAFGAFMAVIRSSFPYFLNGFFNSAFFKDQLTNTGTTSVNQITNGMLNNYSVISPTEEDEKNFSAFVQQIDKLKFDVKRKIVLFEELFFNQCQQYFNREA
jgi:type I restriction enzyme, S subunit